MTMSVSTSSSSIHIVTAKVFMAYTVMHSYCRYSYGLCTVVDAYAIVAYVVPACIVPAYIVMADIGMIYI